MWQFYFLFSPFFKKKNHCLFILNIYNTFNDSPGLNSTRMDSLQLLLQWLTNPWIQEELSCLTDAPPPPYLVSPWSLDWAIERVTRARHVLAKAMIWSSLKGGRLVHQQLYKFTFSGISIPIEINDAKSPGE